MKHAFIAGLVLVACTAQAQGWSAREVTREGPSNQDLQNQLIYMQQQQQADIQFDRLEAMKQRNWEMQQDALDRSARMRAEARASRIRAQAADAAFWEEIARLDAAKKKRDGK